MPQPRAAENILEACKQPFSLRMLSSRLVEVNISGVNLYYLQINYFNPLYIDSLVSRKVFLVYLFTENLGWKIFPHFTLRTWLSHVLREELFQTLKWIFFFT